MGVLRVLDRNGDTALAWRPDVKKEVDAAREKFNEVMSQGYMAYSLDETGRGGEVVRTFDPSDERLVLSPPLVGG